MKKEKIIVYGLGKKMMYEKHRLKEKFKITAYCDRDKNKKTVIDSNEKFITPEEISNYEYDYVIITSNYYTEIKKSLVEEYDVDEKKIVADDYIWLKLLVKKQEKSVKNSDRTFYMVQRNNKISAGLFSNYVFALNDIEKALGKGYHPVVDFKYFMNAYLEPVKFGKENSWEYYFEQPEGISVDEAYESKNVIFGVYNNCADEVSELKDKIVKDKKIRNYYKDICNKYLKVNGECRKLIEDEYEKLLKGKNKVCGVLYRGTDYKNIQPYNHHIQPSLDEVISKTEEFMTLWKYDYIYLATEDEEGINRFKEKFGDKVIFTNQKRFSRTDNKLLHEISFDRENDKYIRGIEYLIVIALLARCNSLIAGQNNGLCAALLLNDKYDNEYIFDLGRYGINK